MTIKDFFTPKILTVIAGFLITLMTPNPAWSAVFSFFRDYEDSFLELNLLGQFTASDQNLDGVISASEVEEFEGSLSNFGVITGEEEKVIEEFHYQLGTNKLDFVVRTTGRGSAGPGWPLDLQWDVNFEEEEDFFLITDFIIIGRDTVGTGQVEAISSVPEAQSVLGMIFVCLICSWRGKLTSTNN